MGVEAVIATLVGVAGVVGAYFGGRKTGKSQDLTDTATAMGILRDAIAELEKQLKAKDTVIAELYGRVQVLEGLVTQKADVAAVEEGVKGVREVVDRIERAVNAKA